MDKNDFLLELGCEELPANQLQALSKKIAAALKQQLDKADLHYEKTQEFATPRRLAVIIKGLNTIQEGRLMERHGPYVKDAYDKSGTPTLACIGFARSCGIAVDQLQRQQTDKGERVYVKVDQPGKKTSLLLGDIITASFKKLSLSKPMRWGNGEQKFIRPVHWIVALFGREHIACELFGIKSCVETRGHRFHHPSTLHIQSAQNYSALLSSPGYVIADFDSRKKLIQRQIEKVASPNKAIMDPELLNEVTGLVEWPVILKGAFDQEFLRVPKEALIMAMQSHQKCFAVENEQGKLLASFILASNIESKDPNTVIQGNEKVIRARLADAKFFYETDCKTPLQDRQKILGQMLFQQKLGTLADKTKRIQKLAAYFNADSKRAAQLCKCDLASNMVYEFPSLQGVMGSYYAKHDGESDACATAIKEHYLPRFAGDKLPSSDIGCAIALADRFDTLVGILGINLFPKADKDPFALRRAALGVIRICIEKNITGSLKKNIRQAEKSFNDSLSNNNIVDDTFHFIIERLKYWYIDQGTPIEVFEAVLACASDDLVDFNQRIEAVINFQTLPEAASLAAANKRVNNILKKQNKLEIPKRVNSKLFESEHEETLASLITTTNEAIKPLLAEARYQDALTALSTLKIPVDTFFDNVMIMAEDKKIRANRLSLLSKLRELLSQVADIALLP